jgi:THO complex subunit 4
MPHDSTSKKEKAAETKSTGGGPVRTKAARAPREKKKPKTAEELDKELDTFMGDDAPTAASSAEPASATAISAAVEKDVDMA